MCLEYVPWEVGTANLTEDLAPKKNLSKTHAKGPDRSPERETSENMLCS